jgi:DNA-binding NarL/FixJ family response regulator
VSKTILLVDDDDGCRTCARELLEAEGFEVVGEAEDGSSAIAAARRLEPDIVILDVQLPDIDGFEVTRRLRSDGAAPTVVLCSSRDRSDYGDVVSSCGAAGFIPKAEFSVAALAALLR